MLLVEWNTAWIWSVKDCCNSIAPSRAGIWEKKPTFGAIYCLHIIIFYYMLEFQILENYFSSLENVQKEFEREK